MAGGWYYAHDDNRLGPFSGEQLKEFAASGVILPTDTVWKGGVDEGVAASRIKNLFAASPVTVGLTDAKAPPAEEASAPAPPDSDLPCADPASQGDEKPVRAEVAPYQSKAQQQTVKKGVATAVKGADMVGQDGTYARYRMKCTKCGHKDSSCRTVLITNQVTKNGFFCRKCKKRCEVIIQCRSG